MPKIEITRDTLDFIAPAQREIYLEELEEIRESENLARRDLEKEQEKNLFYLVTKEK